MKDNKLPPYLNNESLYYRGGRIDLYLPEIAGRIKEIIVHPGAVVILPFLSSGDILLIKNYRVALDQELWELPAGTLEPGEAPLVAAGRELIEETGYAAEQLSEVTSFYTSPGFCNEKITGYIAKGLVYQGQHLDPDEKIEVVATPFKVALEYIKNGTLCDAKSIAMILLAHISDLNSCEGAERGSH
jgi:ADP-ribose pyrophosphatase